MTELFSGVNAQAATLDFHERRHNVLASNVANVDTPGFSAQELVRARQGSFASRLPVHTTREGHIAPPPSNANAGRVVTAPEQTTQPGLDGNGVSLDREMAKLAANDVRYDGAAKIVSKQLGLLRYAANDTHGG